ncbi:MAG: FAD binding domain-containing protein [Pseudomonadota bacterium]
MKKFEYLQPKSIDEAISLLESHGEKAKVIAGGTDVIVKIKEKKIAPHYLISLRRLSALAYIQRDPEGILRIGALTTHRMLERSPLIQKHYPGLFDAVEQIGSVQIRNVATIGGNICNAVPSADGVIPLLTLGAHLTLVGPKGKRSLPLKSFFLGPGQTLMDHGEILTEFFIPPLLPRTSGAYIKHTRREAMELPILGVGMVLSLAEDHKTCLKVRIGLGVAAPTPIRASLSEDYLTGKEVTIQTLSETGKVAAKETKMRDSIRGQAWYRKEMVPVLINRLGLKCLERINSPS